METSLHGFSVVPDIGDFDFDLSTMDTFDDLDIDIDNFNIVNSGNDPFGDFSLEQSLNLVNELDAVKDLASDDSSSSSFLDDFDVKEPIKQDCMWSSIIDKNTSSPRNLQTVHIQNRNTLYHQSANLSLTPPTRYIDQHLCNIDTPMPSSDEDDSSINNSDSEIDVVESTCSKYLKHNSSSGDHCYTSGQSVVNPLLTPPESSEDEDTVHNTTMPTSQIYYENKNGLKEIENDRFNKVVRSILLKNVQKSKPKTKTEKAKFKFSIKMAPTNNINNSSVFKPKSKHEKKTRDSCSGNSHNLTKSYLNIKENKQTSMKFVPNDKHQSDESNRPNLDSRLSGKEKTGHREARDVHNQMERQRRTDLKNAFENLKYFVPSLAKSDRASKQMVLDKAIDHCKNLKKQETTVKTQKHNLVQKNESLKKQLALLKSQVASCQLDNASWEIEGW